MTTFGLRLGAVPDQFLVSLAVLSVLSEVADERPLVCVIDDAQWLDRASAQCVAFVARRLLAESVVMLFAVREDSDLLTGLPGLLVGGLRGADARSLLVSVIPGRLDEEVADELLAEARGNPLALLELPRGLSAAQLAGGSGLPGALSLSGGIEESFVKRLEALPAETQRLLLVAAAEPLGDSALSEGDRQQGVLYDIPEGNELDLGGCYCEGRRRPCTWDHQRNNYHGQPGHPATDQRWRIGDFLDGSGGPFQARCTVNVKAGRSDPSELQSGVGDDRWWNRSE